MRYSAVGCGRVLPALKHKAMKYSPNRRGRVLKQDVDTSK